MKRWARANRSGPDLRRTWCELNDAIAKELSRRESEVLTPIQAVYTSCAQYPQRFADGLKRIERELAAKDLGVTKPNVKDKLKAAATNAYQSNDVAKAKKI